MSEEGKQIIRELIKSASDAYNAVLFVRNRSLLPVGQDPLDEAVYNLARVLSYARKLERVLHA